VTEPVPEWLAAWRAARTAAPQPRAHPGQGGSGGTPRVGTTARPVRQRVGKGKDQGFEEPNRWPNDGGKRREPVLDLDCAPPRVVRKIGWRTCMKCQKPFFSEDVAALRLCDGYEGCRGAEAE
jgi:hypothetical protein